MMDIMEMMKKQEELKQQREHLTRWLKVNGIHTVMRNAAHHLLPDIKFTYQLNLGGGSYTDGHKVVVGIPEHAWGMKKEEILSIASAITGHEAEHVWSSDFNVFKQFQKDVQKFFKDNYGLKISTKLGANILNCTEDGRIEKRLINRYRGYKKHIQFSNASVWKIRSVTGENEFNDFMYGLIILCVMGIKPKGWDEVYTGTKADEMMTEIRPLVMRAINNPTAQGCADDTMTIVRVLGDYLHELLLEEKNREELEKMNDQPDYTSSSPREDSDSQPGSSQSSHFLPEDEDDTESSDEDEDGEGNGSGKEDKKDDEKKGKGKSKSSKKDEDSDEEEEDGSGSGDGDEADKDEEKEGSGGDSKDSDDKEESGDKDSDGQEGDVDSDDKSDEKSDDSLEGNKSKEQDTPQGMDESQDEKECPYTTEELEELVDKVVGEQTDDINEDGQSLMDEGEREIRRQEEIDRKENEYKGHLSKEDMRKIDPSVNYHNRNPERHRSAPVPEDVLTNGKYLNKELKKILLNKKTYNSKNRRNGYLDTSALWKMAVKDHNLFMKKGQPKDSTIAFNILVDYSGSMNGSATRNATKLDMAIRAVAMIEEGLRGLVPHRISFFSGNYNDVYHSTVKDFNQESNDTLSWKRVPNIPNSANRDGYSIKVAAAEILKRNERRKFLIVLSDGVPTEPNQIAGQREVKEAVRQARKDGVTVIAIAFGSEYEMEQNKEVYHEMYEKGIIMVHPSELHKELVKVLKNELQR